jgi:hypothetical protein
LPAVIIPSGDLAEGNAANWSTFAADNAPTSISNDTSKVATGAMSLRFDTQSGFDTGVIHTPGAGNVWDVSSFAQLTFWTYGENNTPIGF